MSRHGVALLVAILMAGFSYQFGDPWLALIAILGPITAYAVSALGLSGAAIFTVLSGGRSIPIVAGVFLSCGSHFPSTLHRSPVLRNN